MKNFKYDYEIPQEALNAICTSGANDLAVSKWYDILKIEQALTVKEAKEIYRENGLESECKSSRELKEMAFWVCAWDQFEIINEEVTNETK